MIKGVHAMFYSSQADEMRAFLRDKMGLAATDIGEGWLIFDLPEGDVGVHPTGAYPDAGPEGGPASGTHNVSFYTDDLEGVVAQMRARGVTFDQEIADHGYGFVTHVTLPGSVRIQIYQPKYAKGQSRKPKAKAKAARSATRRPAKAKGKAKPKTKAKAKTSKRR